MCQFQFLTIVKERNEHFKSTLKYHYPTNNLQFIPLRFQWINILSIYVHWFNYRTQIATKQHLINILIGYHVQMQYSLNAPDANFWSPEGSRKRLTKTRHHNSLEIGSNTIPANQIQTTISLSNRSCGRTILYENSTHSMNSHFFRIERPSWFWYCPIFNKQQLPV